MSLPLELFPAIAAIISGLALVFSVFKLKNKVGAEKHFVSQLSKAKSTLDEEKISLLISFRNKLIHGQEVKESEISEVTEFLERYVKMLREEDEKYIYEAILQESMKGRLRYADKIITKIGIEKLNEGRQAAA